jgi:hypothetical protein
LTLLVSAILAATLAVAAPSSAFSVTGEAFYSSDLLLTDSVSGGVDSVQGYKQRGAADFNNQNRPNCAVATPRSPSGPSANPALGGVIIQGGMGASAASRGPETYKASALRTGSGGGWTSTPFTYYLHAERQNSNDNRYICAQAQVTTDANGKFDVTFPYALQGSAISVTWSGARCVTGSAPCLPASRFVTAASSTGFSGRIATYISSTQWWLANKTIIIDYMASAVSSISDTDEYLRPKNYAMGNVLVTTDGNGNATVPWSVPGGGFKAGLVTGGMMNPNDTGNLSYKNPGSIALTAGTSSGGTIHVRNIAGQVFSGQQILVYYAAFGETGGSDRVDWGSNAYTQTGWDALGILDTCNGDTISCYRRPAPERTGATSITQQWGTTTSFDNWAAIDGVDPETWMSQNLTKWNNADVDVPNWSRDTTPEGSEQIFVEATNIPADIFGNYPCAQAEPVLGSPQSAGTGVLEWYQHWMTFNTNTNEIVFGTYPLDPLTENCEISRTIQHETGHVYGLGHTPMNGSLMQPVISNVDATTLPTEAIEHTRGIYGYSGSSSSYPVGTELKTSGLAKPGKGQRIAVVTVTGKGALKREGVRSFREVMLSSADNLAGAVPTVAWFPAARLADSNGQETGATVDGLQVGQRYLVRINSDGKAAGFLKVSGDTIQIGEDKSEGLTDDVDGGSNRTVSITKLKEKAKA